MVYSLIKGYWSLLNPKPYRSLIGALIDPFKGILESLASGSWGGSGLSVRSESCEKLIKKPWTYIHKTVGLIKEP